MNFAQGIMFFCMNRERLPQNEFWLSTQCNLWKFWDVPTVSWQELEEKVEQILTQVATEQPLPSAREPGGKMEG